MINTHTPTIYVEWCDWCRICISVTNEFARDQFRREHIHDGDGDNDE